MLANVKSCAVIGLEGVIVDVEVDTGPGPICNKDDAIQKLSVIVASENSSGTFSGPSGGVTYVDGKWGSVGGYSSLSGSTMSELARRLAPPPAPQNKDRVGCGALGAIAIADLLVFWAVSSWQNLNAALVILFCSVLISFVIIIFIQRKKKKQAKLFT